MFCVILFNAIDQKTYFYGENKTKQSNLESEKDIEDKCNAQIAGVNIKPTITSFSQVKHSTDITAPMQQIGLNYLEYFQGMGVVSQ